MFYYNETITLFLKQLQANFMNGNENVTSCEFCVKILHRECHEVAKKLWFWGNIAYQLYEINIF